MRQLRFNDISINSGQVFLWEKQNDIWHGIDGQNVISINPKGAIKNYGKPTDFFRSNDDIKKILASIQRDDIVKRAINQNKGLRILRQDPFQCFVSFIISSNSSIQNIKLSLGKICSKFGEKIEFEGEKFSLFPDVKRLRLATRGEIASCGVGYRTDYIIKAIKAIDQGVIDLELLKGISYEKAKSQLLDVFGIGDKVADCILLFSLEKLDAFPLDRWMIRILAKYYKKKFLLDTKSITPKRYHMLHTKIVDYFGQYAGYAQQYLFKMERDLNQKKWLS